MRVAILGLGPSARDFDPAPFHHVLGLPWDVENEFKCTHMFEMHADQLLADPRSGRDEKYFELLEEIDSRTDVRLFTQADYPLANIIEDLGIDYFGSSPAYMLAYAISELCGERDELYVYGVDLSESIYDHQRPNLEFLLGVAMGRGIYVYVAPGGKLLSKGFSDMLGEMNVYYPERYGYDPEVRDA